MRKILFFDIDGTMVSLEGIMCDSTIRALRSAQRAGHHIVICTGRPYCEVYPYLKTFGFDGVIASAGAYVSCGEKVIFRSVLTKEQTRLVATVMEKAKASYALQSEEGIFLKEAHRRIFFADFEKLFQGKKEGALRYDTSCYVAVEDPGAQINIEKMIFLDSCLQLEELGQELGEDFTVLPSSFGDRPTIDGEIMKRGIDKACGMKQYLQYVGASQADTIAFGDGANDRDMLEFAAVGVAMGNATPMLKKIADYVTDSVDNDGIAKAFSALQICPDSNEF